MGIQAMWDNHKIQAAIDETERINSNYLEVVPLSKIKKADKVKVKLVDPYSRK